jgi:fatty-acyl-CoA synthase
MINFFDLEKIYDSKDSFELSKREKNIDFEGPTNIQFTSGTTGYPKGATLSHFNIVNNSYYFGGFLRYTPEDKICIPVPLYHCFGMVLGNMAALNYGATMVYPAESFDAASGLQSVSEYKCTSLYGVPTMLIAMLEEYHKCP